MIGVTGADMLKIVHTKDCKAGVDPDALVRAKVVAVATMADEPEAGGVCYLCARAG